MISQFIQPVKTDVTLLKRISLFRKMPLETVAKMLRYNVVTSRQLATLTGKTEFQVRGMYRHASRGGEPILKDVYPFVHWDPKKGEEVEGRKIGEEVPGPLFILRDQQVERLLDECNK